MNKLYLVSYAANNLQYHDCVTDDENLAKSKFEYFKEIIKAYARENDLKYITDDDEYLFRIQDKSGSNVALVEISRVNFMQGNAGDKER